MERDEYIKKLKSILTKAELNIERIMKKAIRNKREKEFTKPKYYQLREAFE